MRIKTQVIDITSMTWNVTPCKTKHLVTAVTQVSSQVHRDKVHQGRLTIMAYHKTSRLTTSTTCKANQTQSTIITLTAVKNHSNWQSTRLSLETMMKQLRPWSKAMLKYRNSCSFLTDRWLIWKRNCPIDSLKSELSRSHVTMHIKSINLTLP